MTRCTADLTSRLIAGDRRNQSPAPPVVVAPSTDNGLANALICVRSLHAGKKFGPTPDVAGGFQTLFSSFHTEVVKLIKDVVSIFLSTRDWEGVVLFQYGDGVSHSASNFSMVNASGDAVGGVSPP